MHEKALAINEVGSWFPLEAIKDETKREEFVRDYNRLVNRCGQNAMMVTFLLYLLEQKITPDRRPKLKNIGYNNTSEIIARFVENGWMEFYLAPEEFLNRKGPLMLNIGELTLISEREGSIETPSLTIAFVKPAGQGVRAFANAWGEELVGISRLIPADQIRVVFAAIDARYGADS